MHDVVGSYQRLESIYRMYIESAFPLRNQALAEERRQLLQKPTILSQPPLIETVPVYPSSSKTLSQIAGELTAIDASYGHLAQLARGLFPAEDTPLHEHQAPKSYVTPYKLWQRHRRYHWYWVRQN